VAIKTTWDNLGVWQKRLSLLAGILGALIAIVGPVWAGAQILATDAEVDAKVAQVQQSFDNYATEQTVRDKQKSIQDARWRLEDIEYRLLDPNLPEVQKATLEQSKKKLLRRIECIQSAKEFCE
jgi:hypothetical protein